MTGPVLPNALDRLALNGIVQCDTTNYIYGKPTGALEQTQKNLLNTPQKPDAFTSNAPKPKKDFLNTVKNIVLLGAGGAVAFFTLKNFAPKFMEKIIKPAKEVLGKIFTKT